MLLTLKFAMGTHLVIDNSVKVERNPEKQILQVHPFIIKSLTGEIDFEKTLAFINNQWGLSTR